VIQDGSLIFVDEPEISLHPEWQAQYIELLLKTFEHYGGCHFVLATHSPLILSDIGPDNSNVVSLDDNGRRAEGGEDFSGRSSDYLLVEAFKVPGKNNLYLKQEVIKALRLAANGMVSTSQFAALVDRMAALLPNIEASSATAKLIRELQDLADNTQAVL
jgi:AAA domain, putative AbiEii toxin, Type IV TA system